MLLASVLVVILSVAIVGWFQPTRLKPPPVQSFSAQQVAEAKMRICAAYEKVHHAVGLTSGRSSDDPTLHLAIATSGRQALSVGGSYLLTTLAEQPATPPDLAGAVHRLATTFQKLTVDYLAEVSDTELDPLLREADQLTSTVEGLCR
ncbi:hypothetical protein A5647_03250 [Mycobacterium sp. 1100029.7]|nr:hypothetical protein A5647_03250 [Mycobacterium sp. 1100029.7]